MTFKYRCLRDKYWFLQHITVWVIKLVYLADILSFLNELIAYLQGPVAPVSTLQHKQQHRRTGW